MILNGSAHVLLNLKKKQQTIPKNWSRYTKKTGNVKCNKTITALHFVQYEEHIISHSMKCNNCIVSHIHVWGGGIRGIRKHHFLFRHHFNPEQIYMKLYLFLQSNCECNFCCCTKCIHWWMKKDQAWFRYLPKMGGGYMFYDWLFG